MFIKSFTVKIEVRSHILEPTLFSLIGLMTEVFMI